MHNTGYSSLLLTLPTASSHFVLVSSRKVLANLLSSVLLAPVRCARVGGKLLAPVRASRSGLADFCCAQFALRARVTQRNRRFSEAKP